MKKDWVQDLRHSISGTHPEEKKDSAKKVETADQEKKEVVKTKKEPKTDQKKKSDSDNSEEISDEPKKRPEPAKPKSAKKSATKKPSKPDELLSFDPFGPSPVQRSGFAQPGGMAKPIGNPFLLSGANSPQPNLIATAPLSGTGNFQGGYNQPVGQTPNMPNFNASMAFNGGNMSPSLSGFNQGNFNAGFNQGVNVGVNPYISPNNQGFTSGVSNPFAVPNQGINPYSPQPQPQPVATGTNPFASPMRQNIGTNPFLNNNPGSAFSNQNPLF
jgi:hypothetical protein